MSLSRPVVTVGISPLLPFSAGAISSNRHTIVDAMLCDGISCQDVTLRGWDGDSFTIYGGAGGREKIRSKTSTRQRLRDRAWRSALPRYGRQLARVAVDRHDVGETLIKHGLARRWDSWRKPWCQS